MFTYGVKSSISGDSQGKHNDHKNGQHNDQIWHSPFSQEQINYGTGTDSPPSIKMGQSGQSCYSNQLLKTRLIVLSQISTSRNLKNFNYIYRKVASTNTSRLEAHAGFFRLLMKGIFGPYVL